jgi:arginase
MGPSAVRAAELQRELEELGHDVADGGNVFAHEPETRDESETGLRFAEEIARTCESLGQRVERACQAGETPLVIGGDHSIAMGTAAGLASHDDRVGVLWLDAHGDFNTPGRSPSGNVHGMPLASMVGLGDPQLCEIGGIAPKVREEDVAIVGARSIDDTEGQALAKSDVSVFTMRDVDERGMREVITDAIEIASSDVDWLHVSLDMDIVDPEIAPGVGTPVRGGITFREAHLALELVADSGRMGSMEVVEVNPILDEGNRTADLAVGLAKSAFGNRIL